MKEKLKKYKGRHYMLPLVDSSGFKKVWLAEQLGISKSLLSHYINGTRRMPDNIELGLKDLLKK